MIMADSRNVAKKIEIPSAIEVVRIEREELLHDIVSAKCEEKEIWCGERNEQTDLISRQ